MIPNAKATTHVAIDEVTSSSEINIYFHQKYNHVFLLFVNILEPMLFSSYFISETPTIYSLRTYRIHGCYLCYTVKLYRKQLCES